MFGKINKSISPNTNKTYTKYHQKPIIPHFISKKHKKNQKNLIKNDLKGSQFRILNQILYTTQSSNAVQYFKNHKQHFNVYHEGFKNQSSNWDINPVDRIIEILKNIQDLPQKKIIDLGCGDGKIYQQLSHINKNIKSYDLVSSKQFIKAIDISHLPLKDNTQNIAIFCLSLMGTNYIQFIIEASRVLKKNGKLMIAQVQSRCGEWSEFEKMIQFLGYKLQSKEVYKYFRLMIFKKNKMDEISSQQRYKQSSIGQISRGLLNACIYKKR